jgi:hypothetical protein
VDHAERCWAGYDGYVRTVRRMIMWILMIMLSVVIMFFAVIMKMAMIMRTKMITIVAAVMAPVARSMRFDLHLDALQLRRHRDDQGANVSADVEHDRAVACVWILNTHLGTPLGPCPTDSRTSAAPSTAWWLGAVHEGH